MNMKFSKKDPLITKKEIKDLSEWLADPTKKEALPVEAKQCDNPCHRKREPITLSYGLGDRIKKINPAKGNNPSPGSFVDRVEQKATNPTEPGFVRE